MFFFLFAEPPRRHRAAFGPHSHCAGRCIPGNPASARMRETKKLLALRTVGRPLINSRPITVVRSAWPSASTHATRAAGSGKDKVCQLGVSTCFPVTSHTDLDSVQSDRLSYSCLSLFTPGVLEASRRQIPRLASMTIPMMLQHPADRQIGIQLAADGGQ